MLRKMLQICSMFGLVTVLSVIAVYAQTDVRGKAHIPFDFKIGKKNYQSGEYTLGWTTQGVLMIQNRQNGKARVALMNPGNVSREPNVSKLVFERFNDQYFLAEIITPNGSTKFRKSKLEERLAKERRPLRETVAVQNPY
jgi:hypothetical protein